MPVWNEVCSSHSNAHFRYFHLLLLLFLLFLSPLQYLVFSLCRNFLNSVMFSVFVEFKCMCCARIIVVDRPGRVNFGSMVYNFSVNGGQNPGRVCSACLFLA